MLLVWASSLTVQLSADRRISTVALPAIQSYRAVYRGRLLQAPSPASPPGARHGVGIPVADSGALPSTSVFPAGCRIRSHAATSRRQPPVAATMFAGRDFLSNFMVAGCYHAQSSPSPSLHRLIARARALLALMVALAVFSILALHLRKRHWLAAGVAVAALGIIFGQRFSVASPTSPSTFPLWTALPMAERPSGGEALNSPREPMVGELDSAISPVVSRCCVSVTWRESGGNGKASA